MFSWGAGECGQLGTGRCSRQEVPAKVPLSDNGLCVIDVACGAGHSLAITADGVLFRWGLNKCGQLGLGDTSTRHSPVENKMNSSDLPVRQFCKVFAEGHSSAAIDAEGALLTWGSNDHNRLMLSAAGRDEFVESDPAEATDDPPFIAPKPKKKVIRFEATPCLVTSGKLAGCRVQSFAFSQQMSAVLMHTTVTKVSSEFVNIRCF